MQSSEQHPYNEAGRRIKAALISYVAGYAGVDSTLKIVPANAGEEWAKPAQDLIAGMINHAGENLTLDREHA